MKALYANILFIVKDYTVDDLAVMYFVFTANYK